MSKKTSDTGEKETDSEGAGRVSSRQGDDRASEGKGADAAARSGDGSAGTFAALARRKSTSTGGISPGSDIDSLSTGMEGYDSGANVRRLADRYGMDVGGNGRAKKVSRLESTFGQDTVQRWADEGMSVETMGKPRDMRAFRERQESRPDAVPADIERRNQASVRRNTGANRDQGPAGDTQAPEAVRNVVSSPGTPMDERVQREMESKMGGDFGDVQVHTGPRAPAAADSINARAFTVGNHVAFNDGEYDPGSDSGKKVLAHELTHVRQQSGGAVSLLPKAGHAHPGAESGSSSTFHVQPKLEVSSPDDPAEREAERVAEEVVTMDASTAESAGESKDSPGARSDTTASESISRREVARESSDEGDESSDSPLETDSEVDLDVTEIGDIFQLDITEIGGEEDDAVSHEVTLVINVQAALSMSGEMEASRAGTDAGGNASLEAGGGLKYTVVRRFRGRELLRDYLAALEEIASGNSPAPIRQEWSEIRDLVDIIESAGNDVASATDEALSNVSDELMRMVGGAQELNEGEKNELFIEANIAGSIGGTIGRQFAGFGVDVGGSYEFSRLVVAEGMGGGVTRVRIVFFQASEASGELELDVYKVAGGFEAGQSGSSQEETVFHIDQEPEDYDFEEVYWSIALAPGPSDVQALRSDQTIGRLMQSASVSEESASNLGATVGMGGVEFSVGEESRQAHDMEIDQEGVEFEGSGHQEHGAGIEAGGLEQSSSTERGVEYSGDEEELRVDYRERTEESGLSLDAILSLNTEAFRQTVVHLMDEEPSKAAQALLQSHEVHLEGTYVTGEEMEIAMARAQDDSEWRRCASIENIVDWVALREELVDPEIDESLIPGSVDDETAARLRQGLVHSAQGRAIGSFFAEAQNPELAWETMLRSYGRGGLNLGTDYESIEGLENFGDEYERLRDRIQLFEESIDSVIANHQRDGMSVEYNEQSVAMVETERDVIVGIIDEYRETIESGDFEDGGAQASMIHAMDELKLQVKQAATRVLADEPTQLQHVWSETGNTLDEFTSIEQENIEAAEGIENNWYETGPSFEREVRDTLQLGKNDTFYEEWENLIDRYADAVESLQDQFPDVPYRFNTHYLPDFDALARVTIQKFDSEAYINSLLRDFGNHVEEEPNLSQYR